MDFIQCRDFYSSLIHSCEEYRYLLKSDIICVHLLKSINVAFINNMIPNAIFGVIV